jgi:hypothetical protein
MTITLTLTDDRDTLKMLRETLCRVQGDAASYWHEYGSTDDRIQVHIERLDRIIEEIDRQRPLGADGKHGNRHTATCGCEVSAIMCGGTPTQHDRAVVAAFEEGMQSVPQTYRASQGASQIWVEGFIAGRTA